MLVCSSAVCGVDDRFWLTLLVRGLRRSDALALAPFPLCDIMFRVARTTTRVAARAWATTRAPVRVAAVRGLATEVEAAEDQIMLNLALPHGSLVNAACKRVTVPGRGGTYGIQRNSPPMLSELKPGVVLVDYGKDEPERYIISGGFAFTHENGNVEVSVPEGVRIEDVDPDLVRQKADELRAASDAAAEGSQAKAEAQLGLEVYRAIGYELDIKV